MRKISKWIEELLHPSDLGDADVAYSARLIQTLIFWLIGGSSLAAFSLAIYLGQEMRAISLGLGAGFALSMLGLLWMIRRRRERGVSLLLSAIILLFVHVSIILTGGVDSPVISGYAVPVVIAGLLAGRRAAAASGGLSLASYWYILVTPSATVFPLSSVSPIARVAIYGVVMVLLILCLNLARTTQLQVRNDARSREVASRALAEKYRVMVENLPVVAHVSETGEQGAWLYVSPQIEAMLGFTADEWMADPGLWVRQIHSEDRQWILEQERRLSSVLSGESVHWEYRFIHRDGRVVWLQDNAILTWDNRFGKYLWHGTFTDISRRQQAEETMLESENRFRAIFEQAPVGIGMVDSRTREFKSVNAKYAELTGYTEQEMLGLVFDKITHPDDLQRSLENLNLLRSGAIPSYKMQKRHIRKDGSAVWVELTAVPLRVAEAGSELRYHMAIAENVTERYQAQSLQSAIYRISEATNQASNLDELFHKVHAIIGAVMPAANFYIAIYDSAGELLSFPYFVDAVDNSVPESATRLGRGLTEYVIRTGRAVLCDLKKFEQLVRAGEVMEVGPASPIWLGAPLIVDGRTIGVIALQDYSDPLAYGERELHMLEYVSAQVAKAIAWKDAERALIEDNNARKQRERELLSLASVSAALRTASTLAEIMPIVLDQAMALLNASGATLILHDRVSKEGRVESARGIWEYSIGLAIPPGKGATGVVMSTGRPYVAANTFEDSVIYFKDKSEQLTAFVSVPLSTPNGILGTINVGRAYAFTAEEVRVLENVADIAANAIQRTASHELAVQRVNQLQAVHNIDIAITSSLNLRVTLNVLLDQTIAQLEVDAACVLQMSPPMHKLSFAAGRGFEIPESEMLTFDCSASFAGRVAAERSSVAIADLQHESMPTWFRHFLDAEKFVSYIGVPLIAKGILIGVLEVFHRSPIRASAEWVAFLETLATQAALAMDNGALFLDLQQSNLSLALSYDATIEGWSRALDLRDRETEGHTRRVTELTLSLARGMQIPEEQMTHIRRGALLHDIGKMGVPDAILLKPEALSEEETLVMHQHPQYAYDLVSPIRYLQPALDIPFCHHEKWDGTGYPRGLAGERIPLAARIFAVADVWDALTSNRPYREAWREDKALEYIRINSGTHFDPKVVEVFLKTRKSNS